VVALPYQVGITGGIGSGKSTVAGIFSALGVPVYDADTHAKVLMHTDAILVDQVKKEFGQAAYTAGQLDRKYLAQQVFGFPERLKKLNSFVHPRVAGHYQQWVQANSNKPYVLKEAALLFESGSAAQLNTIIVVTSPEALRIKRVMQRDNRSEAEVIKIISEQWPQQKLIAQANHFIQNDEQLAVLPQVLKLHQQFLSISGHF
jgi:dephospho-CoA kinase